MALVLHDVYYLIYAGVSPNEGPPGTLITIRGENLGTDAKDLSSVMICGVEMVLTADWLTKKKITVRSGLGVGEYCGMLRPRLLYVSDTIFAPHAPNIKHKLYHK